MRQYYKQNFSQHAAQYAAQTRKGVRKLQGKVALREANKSRHGMLVKGHAWAKGNSKAIASTFTFKKDEAYNAQRHAIVHHWGAGGGGSHMMMCGSRQYQKGVRVKGTVLRHSKQGARLQNARLAQGTRNKSSRGTASSTDQGGGRNK